MTTVFLTEQSTHVLVTRFVCFRLNGPTSTVSRQPLRGEGARWASPDSPELPLDRRQLGPSAAGAGCGLGPPRVVQADPSRSDDLKCSMKHSSAPKQKCPWRLSLWGPLGHTPPFRNQLFMGPCKAPKGTDTKVTSAKGHFCAYPRSDVDVHLFTHSHSLSTQGSQVSELSGLDKGNRQRHAFGHGSSYRA